MNVLFGQGLSSVNACEIYYDQGLAVFQLLSDDGSAWTGAVYPGISTTASNQQCTLSGLGSSVSISGNTVTMTVNLTFANGFGGGQPVGAWLYANDSSGSSGWVSVGSWQPPPGIVVSISPQNVTLVAGRSQQFTAQVTGTSNTNVTWSVPATYGSTVSSAGM